MTDEADSARGWLWTLAAITAGGAALRLAGLGAESVDLEEYACIGALHTQGLHQFLVEQRALYPYGAPLAPLLYHLWSGLFGAGIVAVRLLSALVGTALILMPALLAREVWPDTPRTARTAGLIAALCVALSPVHLFQAQEARMYAFVAFFAAASSLFLLRAARTGRWRWWALNVLANAALVWSHYLAAFLWPVQALWLLSARRVRRRALLIWVAVHMLLLAPVGLWMSGITPQPKELHDYYIKPDLALVARNLVAGDSVFWSSSTFFPSGRAWSFAPGAVRQAVVAAHPAGDVLIAAAFSAALLWGVLRLLRRRSAQGLETAYLVLWAVLPLTLLVTLSFAWKPIYASRYLVHASLALYLLLGGLFARLPRSWRALCVAVLATVYGWQLSLALPPQTRTEWKQVGAAIEATDGAQAVTLVQGIFWKPIFEANLPPSDGIVTAALEPETLAEMGAFLVKAITALEPGATPSCWAVLVDVIHGQKGRFEAAAASLGVHVERTDYPGERLLSVYRITPAPGTSQPLPDCAPAELVDLAEVIARNPLAQRIAAFQQVMRTTSDEDGGGYMRLGVSLAQRGRTALAAAAMDEALVRLPAHMLDLVQLHFDLSLRGEYAPLADHVLDRFKATPERAAELQPVLESLINSWQYGALLEIVQLLMKAFPECPQGYAYLGRAESDYGNYDAAARNLEHTLALEPAQSGRVYCTLGDIYMSLGRCSEALRILEQGFKHDPIDGGLAMLLADAHVRCGDTERAVALATEELGREEWANRITSGDTVSGTAANAIPEAYLDLARAIAARADDPAVAAFQDAVRTRTGMGGGGVCLRFGVDLARRGKVELAATILDAAVARFPGHLLDLVLLQESLSGGSAKQP